ncbi:hypothetical protein cypCar_00017970 [Cyprinus carpio]|nr:hypothetical protein cypCar_00017970 [Cyprinus carpio]
MAAPTDNIAYGCSVYASGTRSGEEEGSREKGVLYRWQGYSCRVTPERLLLARPVLHAALGTSHGLLLTVWT